MEGHLVGVGAGSRFMKASEALESRGLGEGLGTFLLALVTTTAGLVWSVESLLTSPPRGFSVAVGPGEPARLWSSPSTEDFRLDLVGIVDGGLGDWTSGVHSGTCG